MSLKELQSKSRANREVISLDCTIIDVDPIILMEMNEKLRPSKPFSYANGDHIKSDESEKKMREKYESKI